MKSSLLRRCFFKKQVLLFIYCGCLIAAILILYTSYQDGSQNGDQKLNLIQQKQEYMSFPHSLSSPQNKLFRERSLAEECEQIHIAVLCGGADATRDFYVLLKSILFYRSNPIHLHIFLNNVSQIILSKLFETWIVKELTYTFYNITTHEHEVSWIGNKHYSQRFGLLKLLVITVLREDKGLSKVIMLDIDMLVLGDIKKVWHEFSNFNTSNPGSTKPIIAMVENQSEWYLGSSDSKQNKVWPALGRGYNSGLMLINLDELRRIEWTQLWRETTDSELTSHLSTSLADQDIINAIIRLNPNMIYKLSCEFNIQLNDHTNLHHICPQTGNTFKIVHWNSPNKFNTKNPQASSYNNWYISMRNWDGKLLERSYCQPETSSTSFSPVSVADLKNLCDDLKPRPFEKLRTFVYFMGFEVSPEEKQGITLVVHLSIDRLQMLDNLAFNWYGPISASLYISELETDLLLESIKNSNNLVNRKNIAYHLIFKDNGFNYPINKLRNIALDNAITPYVLLSDVDFLPSMGLYEYLMQTISNMNIDIAGNGNKLAKKALVIPAFENLHYKFEFPASKSELLSQLNLGYVTMFRDRIWPRGHEPTNYGRWKASTQPYEVKWRPDYEPFIVTSRDVPRFDERFIGFGWNKVESIMVLAGLNYQFIVLPEAFLIHKNHPASYDIMKHRESRKYRACIKHLKRTFLKEFHMKFPEFLKNNSEI